VVQLVLTKLGLKRLEPYAMKVASTVLRGRRSWRHLLCYPTLKLILITLTLITNNLLTGTAYAEQSDTDWANSIAQRDHKMVMENFKNSMQDQGFDGDLRDSVLKPRPALQIFVSSSMSKQLLKAYAKEASRYNGALVFRGLPSGSFRELTDLVMEISDDNYPAAMQIDDEAFSNFNIQNMPAIVLSKHAAMFSDQSLPNKFDKVAGNITIKAALEIFARDGDLSLQAKELLK